MPKGEYPGGPLFPVRSIPSIPMGLLAVAGEKPDKVAFHEPAADGTYRRVTYRELAAGVDHLAKALLELSPGPVVGVTGDNSVDWCTVYLATLRAGGTVVPIDRELPVQEMLAILHYSGANIVFFDERYAEELQSRLAGRENVTLVAMRTGSCEGCETLAALGERGARSGRALPESYDTSATASVCYTSGTTGQAKGVMLSQDNILANMRQMLQFVDIREDDVFLSILPVHHTFECTCGFLCPVVNGSTIYISRGVRHVGEDIRTSGATIILAVPLLWEAVYRRIMNGIRAAGGGPAKYRIGLAVSAIAERLGARGVRRKLFSQVHEKLGGRVRICVSGGAGIAAEVVDGFRKLGFDFLQGYGLTETAPIISVNRTTANRVGSVGPPLPDVEVRIEEPDALGNGEIVVRGPNVMSGYFQNREETAKVLSGDGWFRTGDYGHLDGDGFLFITGRKKNVIVAKNGKNVYPEEIELKIGRSPLVLECMALGKRAEAKGEEIWLIVVPDMERLIEMAEGSGRSLTTEFLADRIRRIVREYNASEPIYRRIARFIIREDEFPKTTTRKVRRREVLREAGLEEEVSYNV